MAGKKHRENVTVSLCLVYKGCGQILAPLLIKSINNLSPWRKNLSNQGNMISITCCCAAVNFETSIQGLQVNTVHEINSVQLLTKLSRMNMEQKNSSLTQKKAAKPTSSDACSVKLKFQLVLSRQSEAVTVSLFFLLLHPHTINLISPTMSILYSPQFCSNQETKMVAHRKQLSTYSISQKNRP